MFIIDIGLKFSFFVESLPGFGIRMMLVSWNNLGRIPSFWIVWNSFRRIGTSSSLYVWQNSAVNPLGPGLFLVGRLLIAAQIQSLLLVCSTFQLLPGLGLGGCKCPGIYPFLPGLLVYVLRVVCNNL